MNAIAAIALSAMDAATTRLNAGASNIANMNDANAVGAAGYQPQQVSTTAAPGGGVAAKATTLKPASTVAYAPDSPLANSQGLIQLPNVDPVSEVTGLTEASQAYAFSLKAFEVQDQAEKSVLNILS